MVPSTTVSGCTSGCSTYSRGTWGSRSRCSAARSRGSRTVPRSIACCRPSARSHVPPGRGPQTEGATPFVAPSFSLSLAPGWSDETILYALGQSDTSRFCRTPDRDARGDPEAPPRPRRSAPPGSTPCAARCRASSSNRARRSRRKMARRRSASGSGAETDQERHGRAGSAAGVAGGAALHAHAHHRAPSRRPEAARAGRDHPELRGAAGMSRDDDFTGSSGGDNPYAIDRETRQITLALRIEAEPDHDVRSARNQMIGEGFEVGGDVATYPMTTSTWTTRSRACSAARSTGRARDVGPVRRVHGARRSGRGAIAARDHSSDPGDSWENGTDDPDNPYLCRWTASSGSATRTFRWSWTTWSTIATTSRPSRPTRITTQRRAAPRRTPWPCRASLPEDFRELVMPAYQSESRSVLGLHQRQGQSAVPRGLERGAARSTRPQRHRDALPMLLPFRLQLTASFSRDPARRGFTRVAARRSATDPVRLFHDRDVQQPRHDPEWLYHWLTCNLEIDDSSWWEPQVRRGQGQQRRSGGNAWATSSTDTSRGGFLDGCSTAPSTTIQNLVAAGLRWPAAS